MYVTKQTKDDKMKSKQYRCSCCNEMKTEKNVVYRLWTQKVAPENSQVVGICRKCNNKIKETVNIVGVKEFLKWRGI